MRQDQAKQQRYLKAQKRVKDIKGFYSHTTVYCIIIPIIIFMNLKFEPNFHWFWFSVYCWGTGLFIHWLKVFGFRFLGIGKDWEEKMIQKIKEEQSEKR